MGGYLTATGLGDKVMVSLNVFRRELPPSWRYTYRLRSGIGWGSLIRGFGYITSNQSIAYFRAFLDFLPLRPEDRTLMPSCDRGMSDSRPHMTWLRQKNASNVVLPGAGHLVSILPEVIGGLFVLMLRGSSYARKCPKNSVSYSSVGGPRREFLIPA